MTLFRQSKTDLSLTDSIHHVSKNVRIVSLCTIASRILGLMRDQAMGVLFGAGSVMDTFTVAFRLPNLARVLLGEGALTTAFLPVFVEELNQNGRESAARVTWAVLITLSMVLCGLIAVAELALMLIGLSVPLSPEAQLLKNLTAFLLPYVLLICLAAQVGSVLNALGRFLWPALVPAVLNLVWLIALWTIVPLWPDEITKIYVTSTFVLIGGALQCLFPLPILFASGFGYRADWRLARDRVTKIVQAMLPVVLGLSITQLNAVLDSFIAWGFSQPGGASELMPLPGSPRYPLLEGTATALYLGQRLYQFPLGVFGVALGTVLFPLLTSHAQKGELDHLRSDMSLGLRLVLAIGIPASAGLVLIAQPLSTLFFQYGRFDAHAAYQTGLMIAMYGSGVWAYCGLLILQRGFYAIGDRMTPMYMGVVAMATNIFLDLTLIWPMGGAGLAISTSLIAAVQTAVSAWLFQKRIGTLKWKEIGSTFIKTMIATALMSAVCLAIQFLVSSPQIPLGRAVRLVAPLVAAAAVFLGSAAILGLSEPWILLAGRKSRKNLIVTDAE